MAELYNIYCDESCHLEHDRSRFMVLGCIWCKAEKVADISRRVREIKTIHGLIKPDDFNTPERKPFEVKWTKVSPAKLEFYISLVDYFFDDDDLHFRCILIDKQLLDHGKHQQTHDDWYYKMIFNMLEPLIDPEDVYHVYLDIKDTRSKEKCDKLLDVLRHARHDHYHAIFKRVQQIRSHESELMQLADLLIGAVAYHNRITTGDLAGREMSPNPAKLEIVHRVQRRSAKSLAHTTWLRERKVNILRWLPSGGV